MTTVRVNPDTTNPSHHISLSDGDETWGLKLEGAARGIQEIPQTPSTVHFTGGGTKFGDWEPGFSHLEQRTYFGGRGLDDFSLDPTRFLDSCNAFTMLDKHAFPAPQTRFAAGLRTVHENMPGDVNWKPLTGSQRYVSSPFTIGSSNMTAENLEFWIRRIGSPATLTAEIWTDSAGSPDVIKGVNATATVTTTDITDWVSEFWTFDLTAMSNLASSTPFHVVLYAATTDNAANHWEVGVDNTGSASKDSSDGSSWATAAFSLYYRLTDTDIDRKWHLFTMAGMMHAIDERKDGTASKLYLNGERGGATGGTANTLIDTDKGIGGTWTNGQWDGYRVYIWKGTGKDQSRLITDTTSGGTLTVDRDWGRIPSTDSEYTITGGVDFQDVSPTTGDLIDGVVKSVAVLGWKAYFAQGLGVNILRLRFNAGASPPAYEFEDDGTNRADLLFVDQHAVDGPQLIRVRNATRANQDERWSRGNEESWGVNITFGDDVKVRGGGWEITNIVIFNKQEYIFKINGIYTLSNERAERIDVPLDFFLSRNNGQAAIVHNGFIFFSWGGFSLQRLVKESITSIGPDKGIGLPSDRTGKIVAMSSHPAGLFACVDGGRNKRSSLLFYNDERLGWHEIFRGWGTGKRLQNVYMQVVHGGRPRLWLSINGDIMYQEWPFRALNPLKDSGMNYQHEAYITLADFDMQVARLPKFFKEITLLTENLTTGIEMHVDYQIGTKIGGDAWTQIGAVYSSPEGVLEIRRGGVRKIRVRIRMLTNSATTPPILRGSVLEAFARTPVKYQWNMTVRVASNQRTKQQTPDHQPDDFIRWLRKVSGEAEVIHMRSIWELNDDLFVIVEPPNLLRRFANAIRKTWKGSIILTVREA